MRKVVVLALVAAAGALAFACGDDDDDKGGGGPNKCGPGVPSQGTDGCTAAEKQAYSECVETACSSKFEECYGPGYKNGKYSGPCADYLTCTSKCECDDTACSQACAPSSACTSCLAGAASCGASCIGELSCALGDSGISFGDGGLNLGDSGVSINDGSISFGDATFGNGKTCKDLLACCNTLTDATEKTQCTMTHTQAAAIGSFGDIACGEIIADFCP